MIEFQPQEIPMDLFGQEAMGIRGVSSFSNKSAVVATDDRRLFFMQIDRGRTGRLLLPATIQHSLICQACGDVRGIDHVTNNLAVVCNRRYCVYFYFINYLIYL